MSVRRCTMLHISAKNREGLEAVKETLEAMLRENKIFMERLLPYNQAGIVAKIRTSGELVAEEYRAEGIFIQAYVPRSLYHLAAFGEET